MPREANLSRRELEAVLINTVIQIGSRQGIEKIKTRTIEAVAGINQAYVYQCYSSLDDLIRSAYIYANTRIIEALLRWMPVFQQSSEEQAEDSEKSWMTCWQYLMDNIDLCRYCMRLRFFASYEEYMVKEKMYIIQNYMDHLDPEVAAKYTGKLSAYIHAFDVVKMFVTKVSDGEIPNSKETAMVVYYSVSFAFSLSKEAGVK